MTSVEGDTKPVRIQLSRRKGWRIPNNTVSVARPHFFGNPFVTATSTNGGNITRPEAVKLFKRALVEGRLQFSVTQVKERLEGKNLACWCDPTDGLPCHADVLLEVANS